MMTIPDIQNQTTTTTTEDNKANHDPCTESPLGRTASNRTTNMSAPSFKYQIPVPSPQLNAAIDAIKNTVEHVYRVKVVLRDKSSKKEGDDDDEETDRIRRETMRDIFEQLQSVVVGQLQMLVKPVSSNEYDERFNRFDTPLRGRLQRARKEGGEDYISSSSSSSSSSDSEEEEESLGCTNGHDVPLNKDKESSPVVEEEDEEDMLDLQKLLRVRELRNQIRESAEQTRSIQSKQMARLGFFVRKEVRSLKTIPDEVHQQKQKQRETLIVEKNEEEKDVMMRRKVGYLDTMQSSITNLLQTLQTLDRKLPEQLDLLSETLATLDHSLKRKKCQKGKENLSLSATERAILSRVDTKRRKTKMEENEDIVNPKNQRIVPEPEQRFALFMGNV